MSDNGRPTLREFLEQRFDGLDYRLDEICKRLDDHETRVRALEKQGAWSWIAHVGQAVGMAIATIFGIRNP